MNEIIKIQDERIDKHLYRAYSAVNFEFLAVGLNQSGVAKELDRSELNAFIYDIAEDIVAIMDSLYLVIAEWRYGVILSDAEKQDILPHIPVPEKYDIISETYLAEQVKAMKEAKASPLIINALEIEYAAKKFNTDAQVREMVQASLDLDPLGGVSEDEKSVRLMNKGIDQIDYVLSCNIVSFLKKALSENKDFLSLDYEIKMKKLYEYAKEKSTAMLASAQVKSNIAPTVPPVTA